MLKLQLRRAAAKLCAAAQQAQATRRAAAKLCAGAQQAEAPTAEATSAASDPRPLVALLLLVEGVPHVAQRERAKVVHRARDELRRAVVARVRARATTAPAVAARAAAALSQRAQLPFRTGCDCMQR